MLCDGIGPTPSVLSHDPATSPRCVWCLPRVLLHSCSLVSQYRLAITHHHPPSLCHSCPCRASFLFTLAHPSTNHGPALHPKGQTYMRPAYCAVRQEHHHQKTRLVGLTQPDRHLAGRKRCRFCYPPPTFSSFIAVRPTCLSRLGPDEILLIIKGHCNCLAR